MRDSVSQGLLFLLLVVVPHTLCDVIVETRTSHKKWETFDDRRYFWTELPQAGLLGRVVRSFPPQACQPIDGPPQEQLEKGLVWIVIMEIGGECNAIQKAEHAEAANYSAVIIFDHSRSAEGSLELASADYYDDIFGDASIPTIFVGHKTGQRILDLYLWQHKEFVVRLTQDAPILQIYVIPFAVVIGVCFLIMCAIMLYKCAQDRRRERRHRLPKSALKKIPTKKFAAGDEASYETCCICLDDYKVGDKLRILPCDHAYHVKCIDPWLLKNKRICPQCRKKVFANDEVPPTDSEEEDEGRGGDGGGERAPLLGRNNNGTSGSTFTEQRRNPFRWAAARRSREDAREEDEETEPLIMGNRLLTEVQVEQQQQPYAGVYSHEVASVNSSSNNGEELESVHSDEEVTGGDGLV